MTSHPEATCERCGGRNPVWWADSDRFNLAMGGPAAIVCPTCFVFAHEEATGLTCVWTLTPASSFRWGSAHNDDEALAESAAEDGSTSQDGDQ